jgi:rhodanese-related sulfurtransferase/transcriptional regulator with XRE-family HTH domain
MIGTLDARELSAKVQAGGVDIVDVREPREWVTGHIPGARLVPLDQLRADPEKALPHDKVVFVCAKGSRSQIAARIAERRGLTEIYSLEGGTRAWREAGLPIVMPGQEAEKKPAPEPRLVPPPSDEEEAPEPILDAIVGENLRELRSRRGLTLDALAKLSGVSRSLLGQAELGRSLPSLNVLWKIAVALNVPFATLVATAPRQGTVVLRRSKSKQIVNSEGRFGSRALFPPTEKGTVEFYELWLAPHSREEAEPHQPGTRENLVVNTGRLDLEVGGKKFRLEAGDAVLFAADVPHRYINPASDECWMHLVMTYTPS